MPIQIRIQKDVSDPYLHGQMRIWIQEVEKPRKCTGSLGEYTSIQIQNWNIKSKDPFLILKIIFYLIILNDFLNVI